MPTSWGNHTGDDYATPAVEDAVARVLDDVFDPFIIFTPVRDDAGRLVDFRYAYLNQAACDYAGVQREDLIGRTVLELYPGERGTRMSEMYFAVFESGETMVVDDVELPVEAVNAERYADLRFRRVGDLLYYSVRDATVRHQALRLVEHSEQRYRLVAENSSDVVYLRGFDDVIEWVSPSVRDVLGWDPEELIGYQAAALVHPDDRTGVAERQLRLGLEGIVGGGLVRVRRADGDYRFMSVAAKMLDQESTGRSGVVVGLRDVDDLVREREKAQFEAARRRAIVESLLDPHVLLEAVRDEHDRIVDFVYLDANEAACRYNHMTMEALVGSRLTQVVTGHHEQSSLELYIRVMETGEPLIADDFAFRLSPSDDTPRYFDMRGVRVDDCLSLTWRDVTERHDAAAALASSEERYRLLAENSYDVVLHTRDDAIVWVSPALTRALGWLPTEWQGRHLTEFLFVGDAPVLDSGRVRMAMGSPVVMRLRLADRSGIHHWVEVHAQQYSDAAGNHDGFISTFRVVDEEVSIENELEHRARFDDLTGALKRNEALFHLTEIGLRQRSPGEETGLLFIDVDGFKGVNDRWGHTTGDAVLRMLTDRIRESIRAGDVVSRLGGDEFLVVLEGMHGLGEVVQVAEKIRQSVRAPIAVGDDSVVITVSIGATVSTDVESGSIMVTRADDAMYQAKSLGRDRVVGLPGPASHAAQD